MLFLFKPSIDEKDAPKHVWAATFGSAHTILDASVSSSIVQLMILRQDKQLPQLTEKHNPIRCHTK